MSYQFEDDSALEELLNQQLDSRRRQATSSAAAAGRLTGSVAKSQRPSTTVGLRRAAGEGDQEEEEQQQQPARSKLASWLTDGKRPKASSSPPERDQEEPDSARSLVQIHVQPREESASERHPEGSSEELLRSLNETQLREMSKQSLVRLLVSQVEPELRSLNRRLAEQARLREETESLRRRLAQEASKLETLDERHLERLKVSELSWQQLNSQLEARLEAREAELRDQAEKHRKLMAELQESQLAECSKLTQNYRERLEEEKRQFEELLGRREELHRMELESKLKVNCELQQLESTFAEWNRMIRGTLAEFNAQHQHVESLLDKQSVQINSSNLELAKRSKNLGEQYELFLEQRESLSRLAEELRESLPNFLRLSDNNQELVMRIEERLAEFVPLSEELRGQERQVSRLKDELRLEKELASQERFQLGLDSNRLLYREERLNELDLLNEQTSRRLAEQLKSADEREKQLRLLAGKLEAKGEELKLQNHELHLNRKKLTEGEEKLGELERRLAEERRNSEGELARAREEWRRLEGLRDKVRKELQQLKRLQRALVCSICMERLFQSAGEQETHKSGQKVDFNLELANFNHYFEADGKQLEEENKYVQLASIISLRRQQQQQQESK